MREAFRDLPPQAEASNRRQLGRLLRKVDQTLSDTDAATIDGQPPFDLFSPE